MSLLAVCILFCVWRLWRAGTREKRGSRVADWLAAGALFLCCWPATAWLLVAGLEKRFPVEAFPARSADAIVVLGGNLYPAQSAHPETEPGFSTYQRDAHAAWLYWHWKQLPILVSGGRTVPGAPPVAEVMRRQLIGEGVPDSLIWVEDASLNTYTNATDTARILLPKGIRRIVLVTQAFHMPRAERCFRKQGFDVVPAPSSYRTLELHSWADFLLPKTWAMNVNQEAAHEWIGLAWYRLTGRI